MLEVFHGFLPDVREGGHDEEGVLHHGEVVGCSDDFFEVEGFAGDVGAEAVVEFADGGEEAGAESFDFVTLFNEAEFDGVPVEAFDFGEFGVVGAFSHFAELDGEIDHVAVHECRHVADDLVHDVGFGGVLGLGGVANVLGAEHGAVAERREEASRGDEAFGRREDESVGVLGFPTEIFELGDMRFRYGEFLLGLQMQRAHVFCVEGFEFLHHRGPSCVFFRCIGDRWNIA